MNPTGGESSVNQPPAGPQIPGLDNPVVAPGAESDTVSSVNPLSGLEKTVADLQATQVGQSQEVTPASPSPQDQFATQFGGSVDNLTSPTSASAAEAAAPTSSNSLLTPLDAAEPKKEAAKDELKIDPFADGVKEVNPALTNPAPEPPIVDSAPTVDVVAPTVEALTSEQEEKAKQIYSIRSEISRFDNPPKDFPMGPNYYSDWIKDRPYQTREEAVKAFADSLGKPVEEIAKILVDQKSARLNVDYWDKLRMYSAPWSRSPSAQSQYFDSYDIWNEKRAEEVKLIDDAIKGPKEKVVA